MALYVPYSPKEIDKFEKEVPVSLGFLSDGEGKSKIFEVLAQKTPGNFTPIVQMSMLRYTMEKLGDVYLTAENFNISPSKFRYDPRERELFLILAIRSLIKRSLERKRVKSLVIYTNNDMMPEILLDHGFELQNMKGLGWSGAKYKGKRTFIED